MTGHPTTYRLTALALLAGGLWLTLAGSHRSDLVDAAAGAKTFAVTASLTPTSVLRNERTVLTGTVKPVRTTKKILVQRATATGWATVAKRKVKGDGSYRYAFRPQEAGEWTYRARMPKVGRVREGNSPPQQLTVAEAALVVFRIPAGTASSDWNSADTKVLGDVGDTLRIVNDDAVAHRPHTDGAPFPHPADDIVPGSSADYELQQPFSGWLYCHVHGQQSQFWVDVLEQ